MDTLTISKLIRLNTDFYNNCSSSFSSTRSFIWEGQKTISDFLLSEASLKSNNYFLLDVAAGNLRFEKHLNNQLDISPVYSPFFVTALDNCLSLQTDNTAFSCFKKFNFVEIDIITTLLSDATLSETLIQTGETPEFNAITSFGFIHHIPSFNLRLKFIEQLIELTKPENYIILSFWQFLKDQRIGNKAKDNQDILLSRLNLPPLEDNDYILGWKNEENLYRYCHNFTEVEITELINRLKDKITVENIFEADGKNGTLNKYVSLKKL